MSTEWIPKGNPCLVSKEQTNKQTKNPEPEAKDTEQRHEVSLQLHKAGPRLVVVTRAVAIVRALSNVK